MRGIPPLVETEDLPRKKLDRYYRPPTPELIAYLDFTVSTTGVLSGVKVRKGMREGKGERILICPCCSDISCCCTKHVQVSQTNDWVVPLTWSGCLPWSLLWAWDGIMVPLWVSIVCSVCVCVCVCVCMIVWVCICLKLSLLVVCMPAITLS